MLLRPGGVRTCSVLPIKGSIKNFMSLQIFSYQTIISRESATTDQQQLDREIWKTRKRKETQEIKDTRIYLQWWDPLKWLSVVHLNIFIADIISPSWETGREEGTEGMLGGLERLDVFKAEEPDNSPIKTLLGSLTRNSQCNDNKM